MITPVIGTSITPNHLTTVRLVVGLVGVALFIPGEWKWSVWGSIGFALSNLIDHTDGELARATGQSSRWGHIYDLACDALIHILVFMCIGIGLQNSSLGSWAIPMGVVAGFSVSGIFWLRIKIEEKLGKKTIALPSFAGFDAEDILYFLPFVVLLSGLVPFLFLASIISPILAIILLLKVSWSK
jgi:archaetidylinositol phosphate synthase